MHRLLLIFLILPLLFGGLLFASPVSAAPLIPCGLSAGTPAEMAPCTLCHLLVGIHNVVTWVRNIMIAFGIAVIVAMAILYIVSTGNDSMMQTTKSGIMASLIGVAIILGAWLIVNFTLTLPILNTNLVRTSWSTVTCDLATAVNTGNTVTTKSGINPTTPVVPTVPTTPPTVGPPNPSTGVGLTLTNGSLFPGQATTLTITGNLNFALGPITFTINTGDVSIPSTTTTATQVSVVPTGTDFGTFTITAFQGGTSLASVTLIINRPPTPPGGPGGPPPIYTGPGNPGGPPSGGACPATNAQGIPYDPSLPRLPISGWTGQEQYNYWIRIPQLAVPSGLPIYYQDRVRYNMWRLIGGGGPTGLQGLVDLNYLTGCVPLQSCTLRANWIAANNVSTASFDVTTGIGMDTPIGGSTTFVYPSRGIPCP